MNNDDNNWNTDNNGNVTNEGNTWNTNSTNNTDNKDSWNTNNTGNKADTSTGTTTNVDEANVSTKNRMTALMLCWFLGLFGVHRLYAGKLGSGFLMLYGTVCAILLLGVCAPIGGMWLITMVALVANDFTFLAFGQFKDCYGKTICSDKLQ